MSAVQPPRLVDARPPGGPLSRGLAVSLIAFFVIVGAAGSSLPDFEAYQTIYETGGGHLELLGRDPGFVWLVQTLGAFIGYGLFRWIALAVVACITLRALSRFQASSDHRLGSILFLALAPLVLLKFGTQIREGMALSLWLWLVLAQERRPKLLTFALLAGVSISIHLAILPMWGLLALHLYGRRWPRASFFVGVLLYAAFVYIVSDVSRLEDELFRGLVDDNVVPTLPTVLYWLMFPGFFVASLVRGDTTPRAQQLAPRAVTSLAFVLRVAMWGALLGFGLQVLITGAGLLQKGTVADSMRLAGLLLTLYAIFLALSGRTKMALLLASFLVVDTLRIMLAA